MLGRRRNPPSAGAFQRYGVMVWINPVVGMVHNHMIRRIFRTAIGDWAAEVELDGRAHVEIFNHHPTIAVMRTLKAGGTFIADDVIDQGAEGEDMRQHARRADDR